MLIPYHTDAPLYHRPLATIGLIVLNVAIFAITLSVVDDEEATAIQPWMLRLGDGLHPVQWLTANFLHGGYMHLLGNMLGLWVFGLIVEGKIGWGRFLAIYLGTGIIALALMQLLALFAPPSYGLGASGIIYALMGIALVWAPENSVRFCLLLAFYPYMFEMTVWATSIWYIGMQFLVAALTLQIVSSAGVHLIGACLGVTIGVVMLRQRWVDCEYWDVFSVWAGLNTLSENEREEREARLHPVSPEERAAQRQQWADQIARLLGQGEATQAVATHRKVAAMFPDWQLPEELLRRLVVGCLQQKVTHEAIQLMREYLHQYPQYAVTMRLKLAEVLLREERRPAQALRVLVKLPVAELSDQHRHCCRQLAHHAQAMLAQGVLEPKPEDW